MRRRVDAVVVDYQAGAWLARCVDALRSQPELDRLVVVDNASDPPSAEGLGQREVSIVRNERNRGFAPGVNQGAAHTAAPFLLVANPDLELRPGALERMLAVCDEHPRAGIVGAWIMDEAGGEQRACRRRAPGPGRALVTLAGLERLGLEGVNLTGPRPAGPLELEAVSGALLLVRRECWDALGGFDEGYFLHCEDLDLFARSRAAGWGVWLQPRAEAVHAGGVSHRGGRRVAERHKRDGMLRYYQRFEAPRRGALSARLWRLLIQLHYLARLPLLAWRDRRGP